MAKKQKKKKPSTRKKTTAKKTTPRARPRPARAPTGGLTPQRAARIARFAARAADATCLEMPAAIALVKGCLGGRMFPLDTKLGDIFPDFDARAQFCQCVADGAGVSRAQIPCAEGTTLGEVIDAIAC